MTDPDPTKHPSFGTVKFSRVSIGGGGARLFGSSLRDHASAIKLTIRDAERVHRNGLDYICGGTELIEVWLSQAQFAELLTTMNIGTGVPCTIRFIHDVGVIDGIQDVLLETERSIKGFEGSLEQIVERITERSVEIEKMMRKQKLSKDDKEFVVWTINKVLQDVTSNWPYVLEQFGKAVEKTVVAAKSEVDAFVTHVVQKTGLEQLKKISIENKLLDGKK